MTIDELKPGDVIRLMDGPPMACLSIADPEQLDDFWVFAFWDAGELKRETFEVWDVKGLLVACTKAVEFL